MDLKELAAETTPERDSNKLMDATEPMEESSATVTTSLTKRKAESELAEETDESSDESEEEEIDESEEDSEEERTRVNGPLPEWDLDSFDGRDLSSDENNTEFSDEEHHKLCLKFKRVLFANKGFYVPPELRPWSRYSRTKIISNLDKVSALYGKSYREYFAEMARLCLQRYNQENINGFTVELVEVVRVYFKAGERLKSYITFKAKEKPDGPDVEYQAKTWTSYQREIYPILCRPAPPIANL